MLDYTRSDIRRVVVSAAGALLFSAACIGGAVAPAHAATFAPVATMAAWEKSTAARIDADLTAPPTLVQLATRNVQIGVMVDRDGAVSNPTLLQSSGNRRLDRMLLRQAGTMVLAALPDGRTISLPVILRVTLREDSKWAPVNWPTTTHYAAR